MFRMKNSFLLFSLVFIFALTLIEGQYSSGQRLCDHNRLQRCQQDITSNIQDLGNTQNNGYSGISSGYQSSSGDTNSRCSAIRQNLDCLLMETPSCHYNRTNTYDSRDSRGSNYDSRYQNNPGDFIRRAKQTIERFCEQGGGGWRSASCFQRQDVRSCENQHGFSTNPPVSSSSACRNYQEYRDCVTRIVRQSCHSMDLQLMATYLIDKAGELSWTCPFTDYNNNYNPNSRMDSNYNNNDPYRSGGSNYNPNYDNRNPYDPNRGSQYDSNRDRNYDRFGTGSGGSQYDRDRFGSGSYGSSYGSSNRDRINDPYYSGSQQYPGGSGSIDRFGGGGVPLTDSCVDRAGYYVRTCEDTLIQRQRDAREGRSSNDVQRRICCALFFFRDCISRVVVDRCRDPSPTAVEILMGSRKRDLTVTCREYSRDQCSASSLIKSSFSVFLSLFVSIIFVKSKLF